MGPLTPALPAGRGLSLVGLPVGRWRRAGTRGAPRGLRPGQRLRGRRAGRAGQRDAVGGGGAASPCSPGPALAPPPPWGAPAAATQRPASGAGGGEGSEGWGEGNLKSLRSLPSAPPAAAPPPVPGPVPAPTGIPRLNGEPAGVPQDTRLPLSLLSVPDPDPGPRNRVLGLDTEPREGSGPQQPLTPTSSCKVTWALRCPCQPDTRFWTLRLVSPSSGLSLYQPSWGRGGRREQGRKGGQVPGCLGSWVCLHQEQEKPHSVRRSQLPLPLKGH